MQTFQISRYPDFEDAISELDRMDDTLDLLSFLKAEDYVVSQLRENHSKSAPTARKLAKRISAHADMAAYSGEREHLYRRNVNTHFHTH